MEQCLDAIAIWPIGCVGVCVCWCSKRFSVSCHCFTDSAFNPRRPLAMHSCGTGTQSAHTRLYLAFVKSRTVTDNVTDH